MAEAENNSYEKRELVLPVFAAGLVACASKWQNDAVLYPYPWVFLAVCILVALVFVFIAKPFCFKWLQIFSVSLGFVAICCQAQLDNIAYTGVVALFVASICVPYRSKLGGWLVTGVVISMACFVISWLTFRFTTWIGFYFSDSKVFDLLHFPVALLTGDAISSTKGLVVGDNRSSYDLHFTFEETSFATTIIFVSCAALFQSLLGKRIPRRSWIAILIVAISMFYGGGIARFIVWFANLHPLAFVDRATSASGELVSLTFAIAILLMSGFFSSLPRLPESKRSLWNFSQQIAVFFFGMLIVITFSWYPSGERKSESRILIDDAHSDWERSDIPFDFSDEGLSRRAGYSYTRFRDLLAEYYDPTVNHSSLETVELNDYDVVVLKTPTQPYLESEILALKDYVKNGGSLFIHGDHTDLFGMSTNLNEVIREAGLVFKYDDEATIDGRPSLWKQPYRANHCTTRDIQAFQFLTSCTLKLNSLYAEPVLSSKQIFSEDARYFRPGYFGDMHYGPADRPGEHLQAAVAPFGKGRIAVFCDSTVFSNFASGQSGYAAYALSTIEYLLRAPSPIRPKLFVLIGIILCVVVMTTTILMFSGGTDWIALISSMSLGFGSGLVACFFITAELPNPEKVGDAPFVRISLGNAYLANALDQVPDEVRSREFSGFVNAFSRAGAVVEVENSDRRATNECDVHVLVNPDQSITNSEARTLRDWVLDGGTLVVLDTLANRNSTSNEYLANLGVLAGPSHRLVMAMPVEYVPDFSNVENVEQLFLEVGDFMLESKPVSVLKDGEKNTASITFLDAKNTEVIEQSMNGIPTGFSSRVGSGRVFIFPNSERFSHLVLGKTGVQVELTPAQVISNKTLAPKIEAILSGGQQGNEDWQFEESINELQE